MPAKPKGAGVVIDRGWRRIQKAVSQQGNMRAKVGIQGPDAAEDRGDGVTNARIATAHEFGYEPNNLPQRSFLRSTFDENVGTYSAMLEKIGAAVLGGASLRGELLLLGEKYRADVIDKVRSGIPPPLSEATIALKNGETTPLIDTGQLILQSVRATVEEAAK
jgi:hypothetical protein